ncbi:hypothetical protein KKA33_00545 [Patescibacteria group bacterium]|nr:hypothetical protein [Patescibacteria group bacterium]
MIAGGIVVDQCSDNKSCQPKQPGIADTGGAQGGKGGPDDGDKKPWHPNLVPSDDFDKAPEEYVDIAKCRELLFRMTGDPNCKSALTDEEVLEKAHQIETERRIAKAEEIIDSFCISNLQDQDAIRNIVLKGYLEVKEVEGWAMWLNDPKNDASISINLIEKPPCVEFPEKTPTEKEIERMTKENNFSDILKIHINQMREEVRAAGIVDEFDELFELTERMPEQIKNIENPIERKLMACRMMYKFTMITRSLQNLTFPSHIEESLNATGILGRKLEQLEYILVDFARTQGVLNLNETDCAFLIMERDKGNSE